MRRIALLVLLFALSPVPANAQLTADQREADLTQLAALYAKNYAPFEWKRDVLHFNLLNLVPWVQRARFTHDDLSYQDLLIEYVASLNDAHDLIAFPTTFSASLPFSVDIYDGRVLIEGINRTLLPAAQFPFTTGDELISVDGRPVQSLIRQFRKYAIAANQRSTDRVAASRIVSRSQQIMPRIHELGDNATVVIALAATGVATSYVIPWTKSGIPMTSVGPVPSPRTERRRFLTRRLGETGREAFAGFGFGPLWKGQTSSDIDQSDLVPFNWRGETANDDTLPAHAAPILPLLNASVPAEYYAVTGIGSRFPVWAPPAGFVQRLGAAATDAFLTGTYVSNGVRIGFIRIPTMAPANVTQALQQLDQEIAFFNANTDGLIVDIMRNPGGVLSYVESLAQRFMPSEFRTMGFEIRATGAWLFSFAQQLTIAQLTNQPADVVQRLRDRYEEVLRAYNEQRGRSAPVALNATASLVLQPAAVRYTKSMMLLVDEFSASGADMFAAIIQDNERAPLFGTRTMGAGGSVVAYDGTAYTESITRVTVSQMNRGRLISDTEFPPSPYIENIGVRPEIVRDYMTRDNLVTLGQPFVQAFTAAMVGYVQTGNVTP
jgi:hypothetical protein